MSAKLENSLLFSLLAGNSPSGDRFGWDCVHHQLFALNSRRALTTGKSQSFRPVAGRHGNLWPKRPILRLLGPALGVLVSTSENYFPTPRNRAFVETAFQGGREGFEFESRDAAIAACKRIRVGTASWANREAAVANKRWLSNQVIRLAN